MNADALFVGISPDYSFYLISIANASSALGRIAAGFFSDKIGAYTWIYCNVFWTLGLRTI